MVNQTFPANAKKHWASKHNLVIDNNFLTFYHCSVKLSVLQLLSHKNLHINETSNNETVSSSALFAIPVTDLDLKSDSPT
jgi:hypothetical protein